MTIQSQQYDFDKSTNTSAYLVDGYSPTTLDVGSNGIKFYATYLYTGIQDADIEDTGAFKLLDISVSSGTITDIDGNGGNIINQQEYLERLGVDPITPAAQNFVKNYSTDIPLIEYTPDAGYVGPVEVNYTVQTADGTVLNLSREFNIVEENIQYGTGGFNGTDENGVITSLQYFTRIKSEVVVDENNEFLGYETVVRSLELSNFDTFQAFLTDLNIPEGYTLQSLDSTNGEATYVDGTVTVIYPENIIGNETLTVTYANSSGDTLVSLLDLGIIDTVTNNASISVLNDGSSYLNKTLFRGEVLTFTTDEFLEGNVESLDGDQLNVFFDQNSAFNVYQYDADGNVLSRYTKSQFGATGITFDFETRTFTVNPNAIAANAVRLSLQIDTVTDGLMTESVGGRVGGFSVPDITKNINIFSKDDLFAIDDPAFSDSLLQNGGGYYRIEDGYYIPVEESTIEHPSDLKDLYYCKDGIGYGVMDGVDPIDLPDSENTPLPDGPLTPPQNVIDLCKRVCPLPTAVVEQGVEGQDFLYANVLADNRNNDAIKKRGEDEITGHYWVNSRDSSQNDNLVDGGEYAMIMGRRGELTADLTADEIIGGLESGDFVATKSFTSYGGIAVNAAFADGEIDSLVESTGGEFNQLMLGRIDANSGELVSGFSGSLKRISGLETWDNFNPSNSLSGRNDNAYGDILAQQNDQTGGF